MRIATILGLIFFCASASAEVVIIAHADNPNSLNRDEIQRIYTGRLGSFSNGTPVVPLNLNDSHALRGKFDEKVLGRSSSQIKAHWSKLVFTGKGTPPTELATEAEIIQLVKTNPNIIGYVPKGTDVSGVKVLLEVE